MQERRFKFRFSLFVTTCTLILSALMIKASLWQWDRYKQKLKLLETYEANSETPPLQFPLPPETEALAAVTYRKVRLSGTFDYSRQLIITNRKDVSGPGHLLLAPFQISGTDISVMVSRGFIPFADREPETWRKYDFNTGPIELLAVVQPAVQATRFGPQNPEVGANMPYGTRWYYAELAKMAKQLPYQLLDSVYLQQLGGPPQGQFPAQYLRIEVPPSTHFGYTIEWAILATLTLLAGLGFQCFPRRNAEILPNPQRQSSQLNQLILFLSVLAISIYSTTAQAEKLPDKLPDGVGIKQRLNSQVDLSVRLLDQDGKEAALGDYSLENRPLIIAPVYYRCPHLCGLTLNGLIKTVNELKLDLGKDYRVLAISIDPKEGPELAAGKAVNVYKELQQSKAAETGWRFLTGNEANIKNLMAELGFEYAPDGEEIAHAAGIILLTPGGRISRYFFGIDYPATEIRYSLIEAAEGKIGSLIDHAFLYCFRFDPSKGKYTLVVWNITRLICLAVVIALCAFLVTLRIRENER